MDDRSAAAVGRAGLVDGVENGVGGFHVFGQRYRIPVLVVRVAPGDVQTRANGQRSAVLDRHPIQIEQQFYGSEFLGEAQKVGLLALARSLGHVAASGKRDLNSVLQAALSRMIHRRNRGKALEVDGCVLMGPDIGEMGLLDEHQSFLRSVGVA